MRRKFKILVEGIQAAVFENKPQAYTTPFSIRSQKWYDELSDSDLFSPSCPHLHSIDNRFKMNVYTGEIYDVQNKKISNKFYIKEKDLKKLWNNEKFFNFALSMRKIYFQKYPNGSLPEIPDYCGNIKKSHEKKRLRYRNTKPYVKVKRPIVAYSKLRYIDTDNSEMDEITITIMT